MTEHALQRAIVQALRLSGCFVFAIPNGGARNRITGAMLKAEGAMAGVPDLCVCLYSGRTVWLEVKLPRGRLSESQRAVHAEMERRGHRVAVVRSVDDALAAVTSGLMKAAA